MSELDLFNAAIKLTGDQRTAFLAAACGQDSSVRKQVEDLLREHDETGGLLPRKVDRDLAATRLAVSQAVPGTMIGGRYKLIEAIGEGGMGTVWLAEQREPVRRKVAVKLVKAGMDSKSVLARFEAERQALAMMDHPNIAKVFDGGMTDQGRPYFVMEFVKGVPLTEYCDHARLSLKERLNLFVPVCQAVQHAHQKGIIHRDLKPSNILICLYDGKPVPKVIDFGLAKAMHQSLTDQSLHTAFGMMVGTPLYMSPEQAEHNNLDVDTRTDIYSLGVILYELLTGSTPLERQQLKDAAFNEILRLIKEVEPQKPSTRLSGSASLPSVAAQRSIDPRHLQRSLAGELDWIVMKTLEKERSRRYETANGLARDIERFLNDEAVEACPPSTAYRLKKFLRKNKGKAIAAGAVMMALVLGIIGTGWGLLSAEAAKAAANLSAAQAIASEEQTRTALAQEYVARKRAQAAEARTLASYRDSTDDAIKDLIASKDELSHKERNYLQKTLKRWQAFADEHADDSLGRNYRAEGHFHVAEIWDHLGESTAARASYEQARDIWQKLVDQFPTVPDYQIDLASSHSNLGVLLKDLGETSAARSAYEQARDIRQKLVTQFPAVPEYQNHLAKSHGNLGLLQNALGDFAAARTACEQARDIQQKLVEQFPAVPEYQNDLASSHGYLGILLKNLGETSAARTSYQQARDIRQKLVEQFPAVPEYQRSLADSHHNLGLLLYDLGKTTAARTSCEQARDIRQKLVTQFPATPEYQHLLASSHNILGSMLRDLGETTAAQTAHEQARDIWRKLVEQFPTVPSYQYSLVGSHVNLGNLLTDLGENTAAQTSYQQACERGQKLVEQLPTVPKYQIYLANANNNLGSLLNRLGENTAARTSYEQARDIRQKLVTQFPSIPEYRSKLADSHNNLGALLNSLGKLKEARTEYATSHSIRQQLVDQFPNVPAYRIQLGNNFSNYGELLKDEGQLDESLIWFDKAIQTLDALYEKDQRLVSSTQYLAGSLEGRSQAFHQLKRYDDALKDLDRAIELNVPQFMALLRSDRARSRAQIDETAEALAEAIEVAKADPKASGEYYNLVLFNLACTYAITSGKIADKPQEYANRAMELLSNAIAAGYNKADSLAKDPDLAPLREREDFKQLLASLQSSQPAAESR